MIKKKAHATWKGNLKDGEGIFSTESSLAKDASYTFASRFENGKGSNPEELIAAAHSSCFSMALANSLSADDYKVNHINTEDIVHLEKKDDGFAITKIEVHVDADVEGIGLDDFQKYAEDTKKNCPVSKALTGVEFELKAKLKQEA